VVSLASPFEGSLLLFVHSRTSFFSTRHPFVLQVGIVAVNLLGDKLGKLAPGALDAPPAPYGAGPRTLGVHPPGHNGRVGIARPSHTELNDLSFDMNFDPEAAQRIRDIAAAKDRAVRVEVNVQLFFRISASHLLGLLWKVSCFMFSWTERLPGYARHSIGA